MNNKRTTVPLRRTGKMTDLYTDLGPVEKCELVPGVLVEGVQLTNGQDTAISHGLGRIPRGYILARVEQNPASYYETSIDDQQVVLHGASNSRCSFWVF